MMRPPQARALAGTALSAAALVALAVAPAAAQGGPSGPPSVGVVKVDQIPITETNQFIGRVQAIQKVAIVARVTAYLEKVDFQDGAEVKKGDLLYELERPPFQADLDAKKAVADQFAAQLTNAKLSAERAESLLRTNAGAQATVDSTVAAQKALEAQLLGANASVATAQINLDYTRIAAPIDGKLGRTAITPGNVVSPSSGTLVTIVSQDPMYVSFPVAVRTLQELGKKYIPQGGSKAVELKIKLPDGTIYGQTGQLHFVDNTVNTGTDTVIVRGTIANPKLSMATKNSPIRELYDNEFVTVYLEGVKPVTVLGIPRSAVLMDQQGDYVWVVGQDDKVERRTVTLGQSTPTVAAVTSGLKAGEIVVSEGVQKVRGGQTVSPSPAEPTPGTEQGK
ncbi:Efflux transporter, RND family, MFP subunit [Beijerinckiaceae bacterium RH AL1]|nr:efflux RND transporter periplasmic adaptor subunit [Beijerinckiaceae bacterium]VVB49592.1 Efflux transporter, RND family, MFP subunit [Beijerinckiaceae bacterium RH CH11]VVB49671.1 Efflux transporter, RND family, MFP subunit [Beijerinckiaceae bacterium RH AL8]VVC56981.1 Efflux transporter, RND family, MFP subunit [Beijerinckiaceae bacterium RH AL1]